jgi:hypothetical protein
MSHDFSAQLRDGTNLDNVDCHMPTVLSRWDRIPLPLSRSQASPMMLWLSKMSRHARRNLVVEVTLKTSPHQAAGVHLPRAEDDYCPVSESDSLCTSVTAISSSSLTTS